MSTINSNLLELIESELEVTDYSNYYKSISIDEYNLETKLALDYLVEKYGGYIYRYDNRVTLLINFSNFSPKNQIKINKDLVIKVQKLEVEVENLNTIIRSFNEDQKKNYFSYMHYFKQLGNNDSNRQYTHQLITEIINKE